MKYVLARSYVHYVNWLRLSGKPINEACYISDREKLMGLELSQKDVIDLGGAAPEIYSELLVRMRK